MSPEPILMLVSWLAAGFFLVATFSEVYGTKAYGTKLVRFQVHLACVSSKRFAFIEFEVNYSFQQTNALMYKTDWDKGMLLIVNITCN